jgi:hypothetical protein
MMSAEEKRVTSPQLPAEDATASGTVQAPAPAKHTKSNLVTKLLRRAKGATLLELQEATAWQQHSVRAFLSGLRKKGATVIKEQRKSGETAYRFVSKSIEAAATDA